MLNWVVIGVGDITTRRVMPAIRSEPRSCLYGVVSRDSEKGARHLARVWPALDDALRDPEVNAVYVATPTFLHAPQTIAALKAGRHVLCEKPMAMNYAEGCDMVRAGRESGKVFGVAYYRRMYPKLGRARELLAAGAIGRPVLAWATAHDWFNNEDGRRPWFLDPALAGGGPLYDTASHRIDVMNYLFGKPAAVTAQRSNVVHLAAVEDNATVLVDYENGVRGVVDVRRHSRLDRDEFRIIGTDGEMELSPLNGPDLVYPGGRESLPPHQNLHYPCIENFVSAVLDGVPLASSGETALWTDWVTEQAMQTLHRPAPPQILSRP
ncbi:MAG TPA: Gfo/Idh/MocA family oxidoreductase [Bryobacteraceae bacterium]|nr:Gfo/Idh/MocA family oxidoreductase [Bryobacteraceae bacterium]